MLVEGKLARACDSDQYIRVELPGIEPDALPGIMPFELRLRYVSFRFSPAHYLRFRSRVLTASSAVMDHHLPIRSAHSERSEIAGGLDLTLPAGIGSVIPGDSGDVDAPGDAVHAGHRLPPVIGSATL
jgi:hypothetical protein